MDKKQTPNSLIHNVNPQELQHLITVSTGFIDVYVISCHNKADMIIPQNIVLSAFDSPTNLPTVEWHDLHLPVYKVNTPDKMLGVALIIEGEDISQRFALMCNSMPDTKRLRISEIIDEEIENADPTIFQYVRTENRRFQIPNLDYIQKKISS